VWPNPAFYIVPTQGPMLLLGAAFDQVALSPWQVAYALVYPTLWIAGLCWVAKAMFERFVIADAGGA
jgi:fluoroquinolone transport system permease protein